MLPSVFGESLFDTFFGSHPFTAMNDVFFGNKAQNLMKTDVRELDKTYELDVDLPGFRKEDVKIELDGGYLTITAAKNEEKDEKNEKGQYLRRERCSGSCSRSFYVGEALEPKDVTAKFEDGILRLSMPKEPAPKAPEKKLITVA
ncbi:MAG: Hsp20/alpha crystallin family protein [Mailhella sp.]|nr:Hsp20/alpha crystallin family protein [Mailhella sp.]